MWAHRTASPCATLIIVIGFIEPLADLLLVEKVLFTTWRFPADDASLVIHIRFPHDLVIIVSDSFSDDNGFLADNDCLRRRDWRTEVFRCAGVFLDVSFIEATTGRWENFEPTSVI
jgi:hypothetical protein